MTDRQGEEDPRGEPPAEPVSGPLSFDADSAREEEERWAHRRDPDLDDLDHAAREQPRSTGQGGRAGAPGSWILAVGVGLILVYIALNTLGNAGSVPRGPEAGTRLPPFAAPLAISRLDGDANVATGGGQGQRGKRAACDVRGAAILNSCQLTDGTPAILAFVATREPICARQLDVLERVRTQLVPVRVAAVVARTDRARLRALIRRRGWGFPIGYDRDGAVFARYGIVDCPTLVFAYAGGVAMRTTVKPQTGGQLVTSARRLMEASKRRGWKPRAGA